MEITMRQIEIFAASSRDNQMASYGAVLHDATLDEKFESSQIIGDYSRNQADLIAMVMALRCVKTEFKDAEIILHSPPAYASQVVERNDDNKWVSNSKANIDIVREVRGLIEEFPNLMIKKSSANEAAFKRCIEIAKICLNNK